MEHQGPPPTQYTDVLGEGMPCEEMEKHRRRRSPKMETEIGVKQPQSRELVGPPESGRGQKGFYPRGLGGSVALPIH